MATGVIFVAVVCLVSCTDRGPINQDAAKQIGFYETYNLCDVVQYLRHVSDEAAKHNDNDNAQSLEQLLTQPFGGSWNQSEGFSDLPVVGVAFPGDTAAVDSILAQYGEKILPRDLKLAWSLKPSSHFTQEEAYELIALKIDPEGQPALSGETIVKAKNSYNKQMGYSLQLTLNDEGTHTFSRITSQNIGRAVAIVIRGKVCSYPFVMARVDGGRVEITGNFTEEDTNELMDFLYQTNDTSGQ